MNKEKIIEDIVDFMYLMHEETRYSKLNPVRRKIKDTVACCMDDGFCDFNGECLMLARAFTPWFSDDVCTTDIIIYTKKESRGKGLAKEAVKRYIDWAKHIGAVDIKIGQSSGITESEFNKLAVSLGLKRIGALYNV